MDDLDYPDDPDYLNHAERPDEPHGYTHPAGHYPDRYSEHTKRPERPNQAGFTERPDYHSNSRPDESDRVSPALGRGGGYDSTKRPGSNQYGPATRPHGLHQYDPNKRPDGSSGYDPDKRQTDQPSPYASGKDPSFAPAGSAEFGPANRPDDRSKPTSARPDPDRYDYPNQTDMTGNSPVKRVPRRGDIGIQSLDEKSR